MPRKKQWTDAKIERLTALIAKGMDYNQIAKHFGLKPSTIRVYVHQFGLTNLESVRRNKSYSTSQREEVIRLYFDLNFKYSEITKVTGVSRSTVFKWCSTEKKRREQECQTS